MRNRLLGLGLLVTIISAIPTPTLAESQVATGSNAITRNVVNIKPFNLVYSAYQGRFTDFNIPSHMGFLNAVRTNRLNSQILVQSAIDAGRLESRKINDLAYLNDVQDLLDLKAREN